MADYRVVVVPYDFSEHARAALAEAEDLARRLGSDLHLVHIMQSPIYLYNFAYAGEAAAITPPIDMTEIREDALKSLKEVIAEIDIPGKVEPHVYEGANVAETLREVAVDLAADLIVMGTHGRTGLAHVFLGSVAERTLRTAPCPVLTVPAHEKAAST
jgi:nucleotide-binding universal stress UspA family protein